MTLCIDSWDRDSSTGTWRVIDLPGQKRSHLCHWQHERKKEDRVTNKLYLVLRISSAVRMEGRTVKEMSEMDKQVKKGTAGSGNVQKIVL